MKHKAFLSVKISLFITILYGCEKIVCKCRNLPDLGCWYKFETLNCKTLSIVNHDNTVMIRRLILNYSFDSTFIIVSQRPWDSIPKIKAMSYSEASDAFEKSTFRQYWIINKKEKSEYSYDTITKLARYSNVYGPFKKSVFLRKLEELNVPKELVLIEE